MSHGGEVLAHPQVLGEIAAFLLGNRETLLSLRLVSKGAGTATTVWMVELLSEAVLQYDACPVSMDDLADVGYLCMKLRLLPTPQRFSEPPTAFSVVSQSAVGSFESSVYPVLKGSDEITEEARSQCWGGLSLLLHHVGCLFAAHYAAIVDWDGQVIDERNVRLRILREVDADNGYGFLNVVHTYDYDVFDEYGGEAALICNVLQRLPQEREAWVALRCLGICQQIGDVDVDTICEEVQQMMPFIEAAPESRELTEADLPQSDFAKAVIVFLLAKSRGTGKTVYDYWEEWCMMNSIENKKPLARQLCEAFDVQPDLTTLLSFLLYLLQLPGGLHCEVLAFLGEEAFDAAKYLPQILRAVENLYERVDDRRVKRACVRYFVSTLAMREAPPIPCTSVSKELPYWLSQRDFCEEALNLLYSVLYGARPDFMQLLVNSGDGDKVFSAFAKNFSMYIGEKKLRNLIGLLYAMMLGDAGNSSPYWAKTLRDLLWVKGDAFTCFLEELVFRFHSVKASSDRLHCVDAPGAAENFLEALCKSLPHLKADFPQVLERIRGTLNDPSLPFLEAKFRAQRRRDSGKALPHGSWQLVTTPEESLIFFDDIVMRTFQRVEAPSN